MSDTSFATSFAIPSYTIDGSAKTISIPVVQELAAKQPRELPERYITLQEERPSLAKYSPEYGIPVIDMARLLNSVSDEDRQTEMKRLAMACEEWGFFQVVNHGIPSSLMGTMRGVVRDFFHLPVEERKRYAMVPSNASEGYGQHFIASEDQRLDWADVLFLSTLPLEDRIMHFWPTKPVEFRETVAEYVTETQKLGDKLLSLLAENLGLKQRDYFLQTCGKWSQSMRINYYPPCPRPDLALGLSPHSDGNGITMLLQDDQTEGLQIRKDGEWIGVQIIPDALVVNIGDMVEVMSNGRYKSVEHRAVTDKEKDRTSIAAFYIPGPDSEIGPAPDLIDELHPCLYRTFKRGEFSRHYLGNRLQGKKPMEFVRIRCEITH